MSIKLNERYMFIIFLVVQTLYYLYYWDVFKNVRYGRKSLTIEWFFYSLFIAVMLEAMRATYIHNKKIRN